MSVMNWDDGLCMRGGNFPLLKGFLVTEKVYNSSRKSGWLKGWKRGKPEWLTSVFFLFDDTIFQVRFIYHVNIQRLLFMFLRFFMLAA